MIEDRKGDVIIGPVGWVICRQARLRGGKLKGARPSIAAMRRCNKRAEC